MELGLRNKRVLVTGSSRGIGHAVACRFVAEGARVVFTGRNLDDLDHIFAEKDKKALHTANAILTVMCDFSVPADVIRLREEIENAWGGVDIIVANVGSGKSVQDPIPQQQHFESVLQENFYSAINTAREFYPHIKRAAGNILFITSIAGIEAIGAPVDYATAKSAVMSFAKNLARKVGSEGVRVNCVAPGNVLFPGGTWDHKLKENPDAIQRMIGENVPMQRFGSPDEIASAVLFLCSSQASFITGSVLCVDGGQTTHLF